VKTYSGKTLPFLIPVIQLIVKLKFMPRNGTGVLILSPTRELAMQTFGVLKELMTHHVHMYGLIMGGSNRSAEVQKLLNGINIIVVHGQVLDHMQNMPGFMYKNLQCLVIDEADHIMDVGLEEEFKQIIKLFKNIFITYFPQLHFQCYPKSPPYPPPHFPTHPFPFLWPWCTSVLGHIKFACPMGLSFQ
jgi:superfamily II DNA/RNA helicase